MTGISSHRPGFDRWLVLALLFCAAIVIPRSIDMSAGHSPTIDDEYHLRRGLYFWNRDQADLPLWLNDPLVGEAIIALPLLVTGSSPGGHVYTEHIPPGFSNRDLRKYPLYGHRLSPETLLMLVAVWKAILFVPIGGLVFHWCRRLYGLQAGWLALVLVTFEPTLAAHIPVATLDVLGLEGILAACFMGWRYFEAPSNKRLIALAAMTALALLIKHTAVIVPAVMMAYAFLHWVVRPWWRRRSAQMQDSQPEWRWRRGQMARYAVLTLVGLFVFSGFDLGRPADFLPTDQYVDDMRASPVLTMLCSPLPMGTYLGAFMSGQAHDITGHNAFLAGEHRMTGWRDYFLIAALVKLPIGYWLVILLGIASLTRVKVRWNETALVVLLVIASALLVYTNINIGFRHGLLAVLPLLMLAVRCVATKDRVVTVLAWLFAACGALHAISAHPNYLGYFNAPYDQPYEIIADSNVDWGQNLPQAREWFDRHADGRPIFARCFTVPQSPVIPYFVPGAKVVERWDAPPETGWLLVSPNWKIGAYGTSAAYTALMAFEPVAHVGAMQIYDIDAIKRQGFSWPEKPYDLSATAAVE